MDPGIADIYGRGRIIGDYRRVALYGVDRLVEDKEAQKGTLDNVVMSEEVIRQREELSDQIKSLNELKQMAGLTAAMRLAGRQLQDQTFLFLGASEAGTGIGELIASALVKNGMSLAGARQQCWFVDSKGLVV